MQSYASVPSLKQYSQASQEYQLPLRSRASSASLSLARAFDHIDGFANDTDVRIAQGLLSETLHQSRYQSPPPRLDTFHSRSNLLGGSDGATDARYDGLDARRRLRARGSSSNTWTDSSGTVLSEVDDVEDRSEFVQEYNRLAKKHGVRLFVPDDFEGIPTGISATSSTTSGSWIKRKILRRKSVQTASIEPAKHVRHKRSISDFSIRLKKKSALKDKTLQDLVRLCGVSLLYLPHDYAVNGLVLPTCFRATAQYLVQHANSTKGVFRIPGSHSTINALYDHYASLDNEISTVVSGTVRSPTLPEHISCDVHDVASVFKRFLSGLPGGILGSASLLDAFLGIETQFKTEPEWTRTKQTKVRARLIALAVLTERSQYRRELICAVFGLLSWIGRKAETAPRENERGRPLPTTDYMGYEALGVVFGPLLIGDLLSICQIAYLDPRPPLPNLTERPTSRKERHKQQKTVDEPSNVDPLARVRMVNRITAMLITHWRDVVRHMKHFSNSKIAMPGIQQAKIAQNHSCQSHPSALTSFAVRKPQNWDDAISQQSVERNVSPTPTSRHSSSEKFHIGQSSTSNEHLSISKNRTRPRHTLNRKLSGARSMSILSPTREESTEEQLASSSYDVAPPLDSSQRSQGLQEFQETDNGHLEISSSQNSTNKITELNPPASGGTRSKPQATLPIHGYPDTVDIRLLSPEEVNNRYKNLPPPIKPSFMQNKPPETKSPVTKGQSYQADRSKAEANNKTPRNSRGGSGLIQRLKNASPALFAPSTAPNTNQNVVREKSPPRALRVPSGIVANRLRDLTVSDPGTQSRDRLQAPFLLRPHVHVRRGISSQVRNNDAGSATRSSGLASRDPLKQVSKEDDEASLAALASAIGSMEEDQNISQMVGSSPRNDGVPEVQASSLVRDNYDKGPEIKAPIIYVGRTRNMEAEKDSPIKEARNEYRGVLGQSEVARREDQREISSTGTIILGQRDSSQDEPSPSYMRKTKSAIARQESVRDKIAKFNSADKDSAMDPSPPKTPRTRPAMRRSDRASKDSIVSGYTVNPSPSPTRSMRSMRSMRSERSVKSYTNAVPVFRRIEAQSRPSPVQNLAPAPLRINRLGSHTPCRDATRIGGKEVLGATPLSNSLTPTSKKLSVSDLARNFDKGFDGNGSTASSRNGSPLRIGTILPHPTPPPVAQHIHSYRPSTLPMEPGGESEASTLPIIESVTRKGSNATLHDRVQNLQKQLQAKDEELAHFKHRLELHALVPDNGEGDLGTLNEQLRETRRESDMWKARAKNAERRLDMLANVGRAHLDGNRSESTDSETLVNEVTTKFFDGARRSRNEEMSEIGDLSRAILNAIQGDRSESEGITTPRKEVKDGKFELDGKENSRRRRMLTHTREGSEDCMGKEADMLLKSWDEAYSGPFELE